MPEKRSPDPECYLCDGEGRIYTSDSWWDCPICTDEDCLDAAKARIAELEAKLDLLCASDVEFPSLKRGDRVIPCDEVKIWNAGIVTGAIIDKGQLLLRVHHDKQFELVWKPSCLSLDSSAKEE